MAPLLSSVTHGSYKAVPHSIFPSRSLGLCCHVSVSSLSLEKSLGETNSHPCLFSWTPGELPDQRAGDACQGRKGAPERLPHSSPASHPSGTLSLIFHGEYRDHQTRLPSSSDHKPTDLPCSTKQPLSLSSGLDVLSILLPKALNPIPGHILHSLLGHFSLSPAFLT